MINKQYDRKIKYDRKFKLTYPDTFIFTKEGSDEIHSFADHNLFTNTLTFSNDTPFISFVIAMHHILGEDKLMYSCLLSQLVTLNCFKIIKAKFFYLNNVNAM